MNIIADLEPEDFEQIKKQFPRFIGEDKKRFRETRQLKNGIFVEVNLSSQEIQRFCFQALAVAGLTMDDWKVEIESTPSSLPTKDTY